MEELEFTVEDLVEGGEYEFRVKAVNAAGVSKPSETVGPVIVKDQTCKYQHINRECLLNECCPRYLRVVQNKDIPTHQGSCHGLSVDMGTLLNHSFPQLPQNYYISLHITFPLFKGDDVWNFHTMIFSMAGCFTDQKLKQFLCMLLKRSKM